MKQKVYQKKKDKLTSYFKLKKIKRISNGCTPLDSPIRRKRRNRLWVSFAANVIETLI
jgi:hypothetical protein